MSAERIEVLEEALREVRELLVLRSKVKLAIEYDRISGEIASVMDAALEEIDAALATPASARTEEQEARTGGEEIVEELLWHVEQVCGPLSTESCVVEGDDDRSVLRHNFAAILAALRQSPPASVGEREAADAIRTFVADYDDGRVWAGIDGALEDDHIARFRTILASPTAEPAASALTELQRLGQEFDASVERAGDYDMDGRRKDVTDAEAIEIWRLIEVLTDGEGDTVNVLCPNPDFNGQPAFAIECNGHWTEWQNRRFADDRQVKCFRKAVVSLRSSTGKED